MMPINALDLAATTVDSLLIGKFISRDLIFKAVTKIGTRLGACRTWGV